MRRIVDLSIAIDNHTPADPPFQRAQVAYHHHAETAAAVAGLFPGMTPAQLPEGQGWADERVQLSTHNGTHVDAPWHCHPTMDGGVPAATIDELPLDWFVQPGIKLDFTHMPDGHVVTPDEIDAALAAIGHRLSPLEIVLAQTRAGERFGHDDYIDSGCGFGRAATLHLVHQGIWYTRASAWWAPMAGAGTRRSRTRRGGSPKPATHR